ncbi:hypothetical protein OEA41_007168 [Lepraria neglecta]|uniref:Uncharacterized protein n=1 Tax=Lepraria neglecta TaxID=209136 RepID=A0AAD9ZC87_9LECA|nr:hypothetical protein OEA41_007168 [Lepraria neglecta]
MRKGGEGDRKFLCKITPVGLRTLSKLIWKLFKQQFKDLQERLDETMDLIKDEVDLAEREESNLEQQKAREERQLQSLRRDVETAHIREVKGKILRAREERETQQARWTETVKSQQLLESFITEQDLAKVDAWLSPADYRSNHTAALNLRHEKTGIWFIYGDEFQDWLRTNNSFLWLYAKPGTSKKVLLAGVIDYLERRNDVADDIFSFVKSEVTARIKDGKLNLRGESLKKTICDALVDGVDGMFQWVKCQIDNFCTLRSDKAIRFALTKLPKRLEEVYLRILQRVERDYENDIHRVQKLLRKLVKGSRSVSLEELAECTSIDLENRGSCYDDLNIITRPRDILEMCSSLITISDDGSHVFFAHYTVKEFLTSEKTFAIKKTFYVGGDDGKVELAKTRLTYLNFEDFSMGADVNGTGGRYYTALQAAAADENKKIVRMLLRHRADVNLSGGKYCTGLQAACAFGRPSTVRLLLKYSVDVDIEGGFYGRNLQAAVLKGRTAVVNVLLYEADLRWVYVDRRINHAKVKALDRADELLSDPLEPPAPFEISEDSSEEEELSLEEDLTPTTNGITIAHSIVTHAIAWPAISALASKFRKIRHATVAVDEMKTKVQV